jgi:hypothetical protein
MSLDLPRIERLAGNWKCVHADVRRFQISALPVMWNHKSQSTLEARILLVPSVLACAFTG